MRLKLTLRQLKPVEYLPINTGYHIASAIYNTLAKASPEFSSRLHDNGYVHDGTRQKFKYFTFSKLWVPARTIEQGRIVSRSRSVALYLSSPKEDFLQHLVNGLFSDDPLRIENASFEKQLIESMPDPEWSDCISLSMLSPLTISVYRDPSAGWSTKEYLRYDDNRLADALQNNLKAKYRGLYGCDPIDCGKPFTVTFSESYLKRIHEKKRSVEKLITVKDAKGQETRVKAIECPLTITGSPELLKTGYECGFGENNAMGFGMVQVERGE